MSQPQGTSRQSRGRTRQTGCTSYTVLVLSSFIPEGRNIKMPSTLMGGDAITEARTLLSNHSRPKSTHTRPAL